MCYNENITKEFKMKYKLSPQAVGAIMMALQKSLIEQTDITPVLKGFDIEIDDAGGLVVTNPPTFGAPESATIETSVQ